MRFEALVFLLCLLLVASSAVGTTRYTYINGPGVNQQRVPYQVQNGLAVFDGDIVLGTVEAAEQIRKEVESGAEARRTLMHTDTDYRWPMGVVPYAIDKRYSAAYRDTILSAKAHWEAHTFVRFVEVTVLTQYWYEPNGFVSIFYDPNRQGCWVAPGAGKQPLNSETYSRMYLHPNVCSWGTVVHEIGHVLGFYHEHMRCDRGKWMDILCENIKPGWEPQYNSVFEIATDVGEYDYDSIMHYPIRGTAGGGLVSDLNFIDYPDAMVPTQPVTCGDPSQCIGQREGLSSKDIANTRSLYPPTVEVTNCLELQFIGWAGLLSSDYTISLQNDIDCSGFDPVASPIGDDAQPFDGQFLGNGFKIRNLRIEQEGSDNIGLFGKTGPNAIIRDFELRSPKIAGRDHVGAVVGWLAGTLHNVAVMAGNPKFSPASKTNVRATRYAGGVVGFATSTAVMSNLASFVSVSASAASDAYCGGVAGSLATALHNSYANGPVDCSKGAGLVGIVAASGGVYDCYASGEVSGASNGGLIAENSGAPVVDCIWDEPRSRQSSSAGGTGETTCKMMSTTAYPSWSTSVWVFDGSNEDYPRLTTLAFSLPSNAIPEPQCIGSCAALDAIRNRFVKYQLTGYFELISDVDCYETASWNEGKGFVPIGLVSELDDYDYYTDIYPDRDFDHYSFDGHFNGNGYKIYGLTINRPGEDAPMALFSWAALYGRMIIENVGLVDVNIIGSRTAGSLVGYVAHDDFTGNTIIRNCYSSGSVTGTRYVGGLIGSTHGTSVINSYSTCNVFATSGWAGGLVSTSEEDFYANCYATGSVTATAYGRVGGFAGTVGDSHIINSYSTGAVSSTTPVGGFVGAVFSPTIENCFWDTQTSGIGTSAGGTPKTTAEMQQQSTFTGWDFVSTWEMSGYPHLRGLPQARRKHHTDALPQLPKPPTPHIEVRAFETRSVLSQKTSSTTRRADRANTLAELEAQCSPQTTSVPYIPPCAPLNPVDAAPWETIYCCDKSKHHLLDLLIESVNDLLLMTPASQAVLANDIDLREQSRRKGASSIDTVFPLGTPASPFNGTFDGAGYRIIGFSLNVTDNYASFFGHTENAIIKNVVFLEADVQGGDATAALVSVMRGGMLINSYVTGTITGNHGVGALAGIMEGAYFADNVVNATVNGQHQVGGHVGDVRFNHTSIIQDSAASVSVTGVYQTGSLVGRFAGAMSRCQGHGTVQGGNETGGLVGNLAHPDAWILNSYSDAAVMGETWVAGLVAITAGRLNKTYASGEVSAAQHAGGLVASATSTSQVWRSFWATSSTGQNTSAAGEARSTQQMRHNVSFPDWDFAYVWFENDETGRPDLQIFSMTAGGSNLTLDLGEFNFTDNSESDYDYGSGSSGSEESPTPDQTETETQTNSPSPAPPELTSPSAVPDKKGKGAGKESRDAGIAVGVLAIVGIGAAAAYVLYRRRALSADPPAPPAREMTLTFE